MVEKSPVAAPAVRGASMASSETVCIACKIPTGLVLQLQRKVTRQTDSRDGPVGVTYWQKYGETFTVNGPAYPVGTVPKGFPRAPSIEGGFALTSGIPKKFWDEWVEQNAQSDFVRPREGAEHGMIFAYGAKADTRAAAREQEKQLSGLEPLSTDEDKNGKLTDPRLPKPMNMSLAKIATEPRDQAA
jgi:hypothetical protein